MKKTALALVMCLFSIAVLAQGHHQGHHHGHQPRPTRNTVSFESRGGETFSVFVDGDLMNRMPQNRVMVSDLDNQTHEVVVVLRRPAQKAAVVNLRLAEPNAVVSVSYDQRADVLDLQTSSRNISSERPAPRPRPAAGGNHGGNQTVVQQVIVQHPPQPPAPPEALGASEEQLAGMIARMKAQSFDNDRLALGKVIVASSNLTALQIARLAETIDFSSSQVDFLKYAFHYCVDPVNYYKTTDVLTFSSDKKKVLDYIATQK